MEELKRESFVFYGDWYRFKELLPNHYHKLIDAILDYAFLGIETDDPDIVSAFILAKISIDKSTEKYADTCKKRKEAIQKRWKKNKDTSDTNNTNEYKCIQKNDLNTSDTNNTDNDDVDEDVDDNDDGNNEPKGSMDSFMNDKQQQQCVHVKKLPPPAEPATVEQIEAWLQGYISSRLSGSDYYGNEFAKKHNATCDELKTLATEAAGELIREKLNFYAESDFIRYLESRIINIKQRKNNIQSNGKSNPQANNYRRSTDADAKGKKEWTSAV